MKICLILILLTAFPRGLAWLGVVLMAFIAILVTAALIEVIRKPLLPESVPTNGSDQ